MDIIDCMSQELKLDKAYLDSFIKTCSYKYRRHEIHKKNGGTRIIYQPAAELKSLQYWLVEKVISMFPIADVSMAYRKGCSVKKNAQMHKNSKHILHVDIENFFDNITTYHINQLVNRNKASVSELGFEITSTISMINSICCKNNSICIGSVSSPAISNAVMYDFDTNMKAYCDENNFVYSRYADDMYVSSKQYIENSVLKKIEDELHGLNLKINRKKTRYMSLKGQKKVTGIIITRDANISIGIGLRKKIKGMIYKKLEKSSGDGMQILGYLAYLKDIEPETYNNFIIKYSKNLGTKDFFQEISKE